MDEKGIDSANEYFKHISSLVKEIDREQESMLWKKAKAGDNNAREELVKMHLRLVIPTAKRFARSGMDLMDLIEEGNLGLLQAIDKFDPSKGFRFSTYAIHWIEQYIRRAVEEQSGTIKIPSHAWDNIRLWGKTWDKLKEKLGREPDLKEMAAAMNISARQVRSILDTLSAAYSIDSLSTALSDEDDMTLEDTITDYGKGNPDDLVTNAADNKALLKILEEINPRDKEILIMRYGIDSEKPLTLAEVSEKMGISRERVRQIEDRAVRTVRKKAEQLGLFEVSSINHKTKKLHTGMDIKAKTDILGNEISVYNPKATKIMKLKAQAKKVSKQVLQKAKGSNKSKAVNKNIKKKPAKAAAKKVVKAAKKGKRK